VLFQNQHITPEKWESYSEEHRAFMIASTEINAKEMKASRAKK